MKPLKPSYVIDAIIFLALIVFVLMVVHGMRQNKSVKKEIQYVMPEPPKALFDPNKER